MTAAAANDDSLVEKSVTKVNLTRRTRLVQIGIKNHIWPRRQIKGPRGVERDTSHRFQFGWWCQLIRHAPGTNQRSSTFPKIRCFLAKTWFVGDVHVGAAWKSLATFLHCLLVYMLYYTASFLLCNAYGLPNSFKMCGPHNILLSQLPCHYYSVTKSIYLIYKWTRSRT